MARRVALVNNKGGVGKTTTTVRLAEGLAKAGKRVLVVDMDPQGNASSMLGWFYDHGLKQPTISQAIRADTEGAAAGVIQPIGWDAPYAGRIALAPARLTLENRMAEAGVDGAWLRLDTALNGADDSFDYTLLDCPPSVFHLTQLALAAADDVVIVTEADIYAIEAAERVRDFVNVRAPKSLANPTLTIRGVVINALTTTAVQAEQRDSIRRIFGDLVWDPTIKHRTTLAEAGTDALPLTGPRTAEPRASFELLTASFLKAVPAE
ncbi:ParA family protein [Streptomyces halstedii]|uniref:ParA family protein n=1 Tax=Streptomyces halstedii TaxID=1944 RepID=A0A6N9U442_STRHA|nr:ParA family protein [Streptomyces halstedii]NEA15625.1 ParA family protein [Streptomyces halstedii]